MLAGCMRAASHPGQHHRCGFAVVARYERRARGPGATGIPEMKNRKMARAKTATRCNGSRGQLPELLDGSGVGYSPTAIAAQWNVSVGNTNLLLPLDILARGLADAERADEQERERHG